jgi:hypothetical protein
MSGDDDRRLDDADDDTPHYLNGDEICAGGDRRAAAAPAPASVRYPPIDLCHVTSVRLPAIGLAVDLSVMMSFLSSLVTLRELVLSDNTELTGPVSPSGPSRAPCTAPLSQEICPPSRRAYRSSCWTCRTPPWKVSRPRRPRAQATTTQNEPPRVAQRRRGRTLPTDNADPAALRERLAVHGAPRSEPAHMSTAAVHTHTPAARC